MSYVLHEWLLKLTATVALGCEAFAQSHPEACRELAGCSVMSGVSLVTAATSTLLLIETKTKMLVATYHMQAAYGL